MKAWPRCICCGILRQPDQLEFGAYCVDTAWCVRQQIQQQEMNGVPRTWVAGEIAYFEASRFLGISP